MSTKALCCCGVCRRDLTHPGPEGRHVVLVCLAQHVDGAPLLLLQGKDLTDRTQAWQTTAHNPNTCNSRLLT
jgi:hypothetical protein